MRPVQPAPAPTRLLARTLLVVLALSAAGVIAAPGAAAHTGLPAGGALDGLLHPLVGIDHLLAMVAIGVLAALAPDRRTGWLTPAGFLVGMVGGGVLGLAGLTLPAVEIVIAGSVIVLGLLVILATRRSGLWLPLLAATFGAAHGHAHGAEIPLGANSLAYLAGFVAMTAGLHLSGAAAGQVIRRAPAIRGVAGALVSSVGVVLLATAA